MENNIYQITIEDFENNPRFGLQAISLVDYPAVEKDFLKFKSEKPKARIFASEEADTDKRIVTGIALLADTPIYRFDWWRGEYYITFTKDVIAQLVTKYFKDGLCNMVNLQHSEETYSTTDCTMFESYLIDKERGICPKEFEDCPDGSWVVSFKVNNPELWEAIKNSGELNGFSVEVFSNIVPMIDTEGLNPEVGTPEEDPWEDLWDDLFGDTDWAKSALAVSKQDIREAMKKEKQVIIETEDGEKVKAQVRSIGTKDHHDIANCYIPKDDVWVVIRIDDIASVTITNTNIVDWNYDAPGYDDIVNDDANIVTNDIACSDENLRAAKNNHIWAMITYNDETGHDCLSSRQVMVSAWGYHVSSGNKCFRAYQQFGATHTESPGWKIFLVKRCMSFRLMTELEPFGEYPEGYNPFGDRDIDEEE